jgi:hypothetical protein
MCETRVSGSVNGTENEETSAASDAFEASLLINVQFGLFFFFAFCVLRTRLRSVYSPRARLLKGTSNAPPALPRGFLAWIKPLILLDEENLTASAGLDATMYLRFLFLSFQLFTIASFVGCGFVLPINVYYDNVYYAELEDGTIYMAPDAANTNNSLDGANTTNTTTQSNEKPWHPANFSRPFLDRLSLTHVRDGSPILWVHFVFVHFMTACALYLIHQNFRGFAALRHKAILDGRVHHKWVLVDNIPLHLRQESTLSLSLLSLSLSNTHTHTHTHSHTHTHTIKIVCGNVVRHPYYVLLRGQQDYSHPHKNEVVGSNGNRNYF